MFNTLTNAFNINIKLGDDTNKTFNQPINAQLEGYGVYDKSMIDSINTVFTCKKILIETISKLPLNITSKNKKYKEHYLFNIIHNKPNTYQTTNVFISTLLNHFCSFGNAFAKINKVEGRVNNLQIIHPSKFKGYELNEFGVLTYKFVDFNIISDDILHFKYFVSDDGILGLSPLDALNKLLAGNYQAIEIINNYYKNGLHSNLFIKAMTNVQSKDYNIAQQDWAKSQSGVFKAGEIKNLPFGSELQEIGIQFTDAQLLPTIKYNTSQIGAVYGIPLFMLGIEEMKYKSIEESLIAFQTQTIAPLAKIFKEEFSSKLLFDKERINEDINIEFNLNAMLAADSITRANYLKTLKDATIISPNEAAKIEGFDEFEGGQYHYQQSQYQPLELITKDGEFKPITNGQTFNIQPNN
jgi:HK97 family phage portal protein